MSRASDILDLAQNIDEVGAKLILRVRNKKVQRKLVCPKFHKKDGMACIKLTASEANKLSKMRKKQFKRKMKQKLRQILRKRAKSMGFRQTAVPGTSSIKIDDKGGNSEPSK